MRDECQTRTRLCARHASQTSTAETSHIYRPSDISRIHSKCTDSEQATRIPPATTTAIHDANNRSPVRIRPRPSINRQAQSATPLPLTPWARQLTKCSVKQVKCSKDGPAVKSYPWRPAPRTVISSCQIIPGATAAKIQPNSNRRSPMECKHNAAIARSNPSGRTSPAHPTSVQPREVRP